MQGENLNARSRASSDANDDEESLKSRISKWWARMRHEYLNTKGAKSAFYAFMSLLIFLAVAGSLGTALYVGVLALGPITTGLILASPLGVPALALSLVGSLLLIASIAALLRFVQIHWEMYKFYAIKYMLKHPLGYAFVLFAAAFVMDVNTQIAIQFYNTKPFGMAAKLKHLILGYKYQALAILAALAVGIAVAVPLVPYLMGVVMASFALPYGVAVLFGAAAAATIIAITYQLLASLTTLNSLYKLAKEVYSHGIFKLPAYAYFIGALAFIGVAVATAGAYLFFTPLVNVLTPVLASSSLATFLAVAVSLSLAVALMKFLPALVVDGPLYLKESFYENSSLETWMNDDQRFWAGKSKGVHSSLDIGDKPAPASSSCFGLKQAKQDDAPVSRRGFFSRCLGRQADEAEGEEQGYVPQQDIQNQS